MKKIHILAACLVALCACTQKAPAPQKPDDQNYHERRKCGGSCESEKAKAPVAPQVNQSAQAPQAAPVAPQSNTVVTPAAPAAPQSNQTVATPEVKVEKSQ